MKIAIKQLAHGRGLPMPTHATAGSAGLDLCAAIENEMVLAPGQYAGIPTGIAIALPEGYEAQVRPRSGLALRHGVTVLNAPGTIDSDYRGEVSAILINHGAEPFAIPRGMKIAQLIVAAHARVEWIATTELDDTLRGAGGFGSTGLGV